MPLTRRAHPVAMFSAWFFVVFLVLFPKGGIKLGVLPITWGYLYLALSFLPLVIVRVLALPLRWPRRVLLACAMLLPMQLLFLYAGVFNGVADPPFAFSSFVALFALPWLFLLVYAPFLPFIDGERLSRYLRWSMLAAALWGIFLFFLHPLTGHFIEIPLLTVNAADVGELETTKHIARGLFFKLISTYNNGNLYGVATLILLPMYRELERVRWRRAVMIVALLLTLSRTVWAGLLLLEAFPVIALLARQFQSFPMVYLRSAWRRIAVVAVTLALIFAALIFMSRGPNALQFLLDPTLGGRAGEIGSVQSGGLTLLPSRPLAGFAEVLYATAAQDFGLAGLAAFVLMMVSPIVLLVLEPQALRSPMRRAALQGLVLYIVLGASDGGLDFIPVMAFYWFAYMIYLFDWPARDGTKEQVSLPAGGPQNLLPSASVG
jgi:hypothetical protein